MTTDTMNARVIVSINPATGESLGEVPYSSPDDITCTVRRARQAQAAWGKTPLPDRLALVEKFRRLLMRERESVASLITREAGKPYGEALVAEVFACLEICSWLKGRAPRILAKQRVDLNPIFFFGKRGYNLHQPLGVIGVISPWNYPFAIPCASALLALTAGNAVVVKPSPRTPLVASALVSLLARAGFEPELVGLVQGDKEEAEHLILSGIDRLVFTGSVEGGKAIMEIASRKLVPVTLELGGKHPAIVLPDADPDKVAGALVWCAFTNAGQACASLDRLYIHEAVAAPLLDRMIELTSRLRLGNGMSPETDVGPVIDEIQLARCKELVDDAVGKGASVLVGGKSRTDLGGFFFEPTIVAGITDEMKIADREIFGPILPVRNFESVKGAVEQSNKSSLALTASVWTPDLGLAEELARDIDAGVVWINDGLYSYACPDAPWGGLKDSGFGRAHSEAELLDYVNVKHVGVSRQGRRDWHFPYSRERLSYLDHGLELLHAEGLKARGGALRRLLRGKLKGDW